MAEKFLETVYGVKTADEARDLYDRWSVTYDDEVGAEGYATPARLAAALRKFADPDAPLLDYGCGTGLSGRALAAEGFAAIDGMDISAEMLAGAKTKGAYRNLTHVDPNAPIPANPGDYASVVACGVISKGAAPIELFDMLIGLLTKGGFFAFSFNDHTLEDPEFEAKVMEWTDTGAATLLFREHGDHLPGIGLRSVVYVLKKN